MDSLLVARSSSMCCAVNQEIVSLGCREELRFQLHPGGERGPKGEWGTRPEAEGVGGEAGEAHETGGDDVGAEVGGGPAIPMPHVLVVWFGRNL